MQEAKINLGKVVRVARKRKRITQDYLAEKVGVQPRTILEIENGRGNPRFENLFVMVRLLDIAPNDTHPSAKHSASPKAADMTRFSGRCW